MLPPSYTAPASPPTAAGAPPHPTYGCGGAAGGQHFPISTYADDVLVCVENDEGPAAALNALAAAAAVTARTDAASAVACSCPLHCPLLPAAAANDAAGQLQPGAAAQAHCAPPISAQLPGDTYVGSYLSAQPPPCAEHRQVVLPW